MHVEAFCVNLALKLKDELILGTVIQSEGCYLKAGEALYSPQRRFELRLEASGNLTVYNPYTFQTIW